MSTWQIVLLEPAKLVLEQIGQFLVNVLLVLVILIIGWLIAKLIKIIVTRVLRALRFDALSERIELDSLLAKGGIKYSISELLGIIAYWLTVLVTFMVAVNASPGLPSKTAFAGSRVTNFSTFPSIVKLNRGRRGSLV